MRQIPKSGNDNVRKYAYPIREGLYKMNGREEIAWLDYLWNTGDVTRAWFVGPASAHKPKIYERKVPDRSSQ